MTTTALSLTGPKKLYIAGSEVDVFVYYTGNSIQFTAEVFQDDDVTVQDLTGFTISVTGKYYQFMGDALPSGDIIDITALTLLSNPLPAGVTAVIQSPPTNGIFTVYAPANLTGQAPQPILATPLDVVYCVLNVTLTNIDPATNNSIVQSIPYGLLLSYL